MGIFSFLGNLFRRKAPVRQPRTPQDLIREEAEINKAMKNPRHPAVRISPEMNKQVQDAVRAAQAKKAVERSRRASRYNLRR